MQVGGRYDKGTDTRATNVVERDDGVSPKIMGSLHSAWCRGRVRRVRRGHDTTKTLVNPHP